MKTHTLHISGTHCPSCKLLVEDILGEHEMVHNVRVNLKNQTVDVNTDDEYSIDEVIHTLNPLVQSHKYSLSVEKSTHMGTNGNVLGTAILIGLAFLVLFFWLQKSGVLNIGIGGTVTPITSALIGLVASVSSCLAIVGGLVLSLSAKISQDKIRDTKTFILFHTGRVVGFAVLGGMLGLLGQAIGISFTASALLGLIAAIIMVLLGLNLIGLMSRNHATLPLGIFKWFRTIEHKTWAPLLIGVGTFFLPCGFTQSMQVAALSSGSFWGGLFIMFAFALGTLPMLALLSFGSSSLAQSRYAPLFFKSAGIVVIGLGIFAFLAGLAGLGIINPLFTV